MLQKVKLATLRELKANILREIESDSNKEVLIISIDHLRVEAFPNKIPEYLLEFVFPAFTSAFKETPVWFAWVRTETGPSSIVCTWVEGKTQAEKINKLRSVLLHQWQEGVEIVDIFKPLTQVESNFIDEAVTHKL